ncbi:hypothetical protein ACFFK0_00940 [Paenibacillus chartarius]|uniref:Uncharacterized protein n=1 Tax=Paenibacillus chartarius TaxID=747481 RepID=A0ABV6DEH8_9BACL
MIRLDDGETEQTVNAAAMEFILELNRQDDELLRRFVLTYEGRELSLDEARSFIAFVREQR